MVAPLRLEDNPNDVEFYKNHGADVLPRNTGESLAASFELAFKDTLSGSVKRSFDLAEFRDDSTSPMLQPKELRAKFPNMDPNVFDEPMRLALAEEISKRRQERERLEISITNGPQGGFYGLAHFGAMMAAHMLDPAELALGLATGGAFTAIKAGRVAFRAGEGVAAATRVGVRNFAPLRAVQTNSYKQIMGENFIANAAVEIPVVHANQQEKIDYDMVDALVNTTAGTLAGSGLQIGIGKLARFLRQHDPKLGETGMKVALAQAASDQKIDVEPVIKDRISELSGDAKSPQVSRFAEYNYEPMNVDLPQGKTMYHGSRQRAPEIRKADHNDVVRYDDDFGTGVYLTDNPKAANGAAVSKYSSDGPGQVHQIELNEARILDLERSVPENLRETLSDMFGNRIPKERLDKAVTGNMRGLYDEVRSLIDQGKATEEVLDDINVLLKDDGIDGIRYESRGTLDNPTSSHNAVVMFGFDRMKEKGLIEADASFLPSITRNEAADVARAKLKPENDYLHRQQDVDEVNDLASVEEKFDEQRVENNFNDLNDDIRQAIDEGRISDQDAAEYEDALKVAADFETKVKIGKAARKCLSGDNS